MLWTSYLKMTNPFPKLQVLDMDDDHIDSNLPSRIIDILSPQAIEVGLNPHTEQKLESKISFITPTVTCSQAEFLGDSPDCLDSSI